MKISELFETLKISDAFRSRSISEQEIRDSLLERSDFNVQSILFLFSNAKATKEPNIVAQSILDTQKLNKRMTERNALEMATMVHMDEYEYPYILWEAINNALDEYDEGKPEHTIEWWYEQELNKKENR